MEGGATVLVTVMMVASGFIMSTAAEEDLSDLCEFEAKFPGATDSCFSEEELKLKEGYCSSKETTTKPNQRTDDPKLITPEEDVTTDQPASTAQTDPTNSDGISTEQEDATNPTQREVPANPTEQEDVRSSTDLEDATSPRERVEATSSTERNDATSPTEREDITSPTGDSISWCPSNMVYGNCTCGQRLCRDPTTCLDTCMDGRSEGCICPGGYYMEESECVPETDCGCYISEEQTVVPEGDTYINIGCTRIANCSNGQLTTRTEEYECSPNAVCEERTGTRRCYCNEGFTEDGETCEWSIPPTDCMDIYNAGSGSGVYSIKPRDWPGSPFSVYCNMTDGGGWTVFQRRIDGDVDFYQDWNTYKQGFGDVGDEHWLGNEQLYYLTKQGNYQLKIDLVNSNGAPYYAKFSSFSINNEADNYRLADVSGYSGTDEYRSSPDGYALTYHRGRQFGTKDRNYHCARIYHAAWWYLNCHQSHLVYDGSEWHSISWQYLPGGYHNIKYTEMKIRPV